MRNVRLWRGLLGVDKRTVIEDIEFDQQGAGGAELVAGARWPLVFLSPAPCAARPGAGRSAPRLVVTVSGLDNGSSPNPAKTLPRDPPHHGASRV